jgi:hypothetical protein
MHIFDVFYTKMTCILIFLSLLLTLVHLKTVIYYPVALSSEMVKAGPSQKTAIKHLFRPKSIFTIRLIKHKT